MKHRLFAAIVQVITEFSIICPVIIIFITGVYPQAVRYIVLLPLDRSVTWPSHYVLLNTHVDLLSLYICNVRLHAKYFLWLSSHLYVVLSLYQYRIYLYVQPHSFQLSFNTACSFYSKVCLYVHLHDV